MPLIESLTGPTTTQVGQEHYTFIPDRFGRPVARVDKERHIDILTGAGTYRVVPDQPVEALSGDAASQGDTDRVAKGDFDKVTAALAKAQGELRTAMTDLDAALQDKGRLETRVTELEGELTKARADIAEFEALINGDDPSEPATPATPDALEDLGGLGKAMAKKLNADGITTFAQLAALDDAALAALDERLDLGGAASRNQWNVQAKAMIEAAKQGSDQG